MLCYNTTDVPSTNIDLRNSQLYKTMIYILLNADLYNCRNIEHNGD